MPSIIENKKRLVIFIAVIVLIIGGIIFAIVKWRTNSNPDNPDNSDNSENQGSVYEALIMTQDEAPNDKNSPSALRPGDVMVIFPEGHSWSETERISYLMLKLKLEKSDADKLVQPASRRRADVSASRGGPETIEGPEEEIVQARQYRIKIEKLDFDAKMIWKNGQPYPDKIFDDSLIEKK